MTVEFTVDEKDKMKVEHADTTEKRFAIKLGDVEIFLSRNDLVELEEKIEDILWDESNHRDKLEEELDRVTSELEEAKEEIEQYKEVFEEARDSGRR